MVTESLPLQERHPLLAVVAAGAAGAVGYSPIPSRGPCGGPYGGSPGLRLLPSLQGLGQGLPPTILPAAQRREPREVCVCVCHTVCSGVECVVEQSVVTLGRT